MKRFQERSAHPKRVVECLCENEPPERGAEKWGLCRG